MSRCPAGGETDASAELADFEIRLKKLEVLKGKIPNELYEAKLQEILDSI